MSQLEGRRILVTGAGSGIGAAIAEAAAAAGASVAVNDLDPARAEATVERITASGATAIAVPGDVAGEATARDLVAAAAEGLRGLDGLVNNAGILTMHPLVDMDAAEWEQVLSVNAGGPVFCSKAALAHFDGPAAIVNIASIAGNHPGGGLAAYSMSKATVVSFTKLAAIEWGPQGVRVNAIAPGAISFTSMSAAETAEDRDARGRAMPLGRTGRADDIADVAVFLLSDGARYMTGAVVPVDGGWSVSVMSLTARPWES